MTDDTAAGDPEAAADAPSSSDDGAVADAHDAADETTTGAGDDTDARGSVVDGVADRDDAVAVAATALRHGDLVVVPTDTVYGVTADAFNPAATSAVFDAKRRQRRFPLPVLIRSPKQLMGLVTAVPETAERLMAAYWPGPLTLVVRADPNLAWELGQNDGTVAVRMPMDDIMLDIIRAVGPLATTSANLSGQPAATTVDLARSQLGDAIAVYVDGGRRAETQPSTIVDLTRSEPSILRSGPLPDDEVLAVARGEVESHQASAPRPRHKPVSPGGPAETTPTQTDRDTGTRAGTGGTAADPELASDTPTGPGPEDAPATATATAAAGATAAATRDHRADSPDTDDAPDAPDAADTAGDAADDTTAQAPATDRPRRDAVAVDHRAAAAAGSTSTRRTRRRTSDRVATAAAEPTDTNEALATEDATKADTATPDRPRRRARSRPSEATDPPSDTNEGPANEDASGTDATTPDRPRRRARSRSSDAATRPATEPTPDTADTEAAPDTDAKTDPGSADETPRRTGHHVARDHRAG